MRAAILKQSRKIDDYIQLTRKFIKGEPSTPALEAVEFLLHQATEAYFDLNETALKLPDLIEKNE